MTPPTRTSSLWHLPCSNWASSPSSLDLARTFYNLKLAWQHHFTALEASTFDIEWNGEAKTTPRTK
jgi:hypothetical protein